MPLVMGELVDSGYYRAALFRQEMKPGHANRPAQTHGGKADEEVNRAAEQEGHGVPADVLERQSQKAQRNAQKRQKEQRERQEVSHEEEELSPQTEGRHNIPLDRHDDAVDHERQQSGQVKLLPQRPGPEAIIPFLGDRFPSYGPRGGTQ